MSFPSDKMVDYPDPRELAQEDVDNLTQEDIGHLDVTNQLYRKLCLEDGSEPFVGVGQSMGDGEQQLAVTAEVSTSSPLHGPGY